MSWIYRWVKTVWPSIYHIHCFEAVCVGILSRYFTITSISCQRRKHLLAGSTAHAAQSPHMWLTNPASCFLRCIQDRRWTAGGRQYCPLPVLSMITLCLPARDSIRSERHNSTMNSINLQSQLAQRSELSRLPTSAPRHPSLSVVSSRAPTSPLMTV